MLENIDLKKSIDKKSFKEQFEKLELELAALQREARELEIPIIILFEGWDAAGKGTQINELILPLDPRGFKVHTIGSPNKEERMKPFLWRFWVKSPAKGRIAVFDTSWYRNLYVCKDMGRYKISKKEPIYKDINAFERQLTIEGTLLIKLFFHISKKEQKKRLKGLAKNPATSWRVKSSDRYQNRHYKDFHKKFTNFIEKTDTDYSRWNIIEATDSRYATLKMFKTVISELKKRIKTAKKDDKNSKKEAKKRKGSEEIPNILAKYNLKQDIPVEQYKNELKVCQEKLRELEHIIYLKRIPVLIMYEGWDAAGKGGNIRRVTARMDPRGYEVVPISAPDKVEQAHHYLWRFWDNIPKAGHLTIFDRTWYGRVLVERVEGFCSKEAWSRAYDEINELEKHLHNSGMVIIKFWLQIDKEEQLRRFEARKNNEFKRWKITEEDWRNREKWDLYENAVNEMLHRTDKSYAPWTVVESNSKRFARIKVLNTIIERIESRLQDDYFNR